MHSLYRQVYILYLQPCREGVQLNENFQTLINAIVKAKPAAAKGQYLKSVVIASTMGPGVKINTTSYV